MLPGTLFIIAAPSGAGKTSLVNALLAQDSQLSVSISHTTRPPRPGEVDGKNYYFVSDAEFNQLKAQSDFLECAQVFDYQYGTKKSWVLEQLAAGQDVILEIDWQGARRVREQLPSVSIFIFPPSYDDLRHRLEQREQDEQAVIERRLAEARVEVRHADEFDHWVVNEAFDVAIEALLRIIRSVRANKPIVTKIITKKLVKLFEDH